MQNLFKPACLSLIACIMLISCSEKKPADQATLVYPKTEKGNQTDQYFGTTVSDPYRWLEDDTSAKTKAWVEAENKTTLTYLSAIPARDKIKNRLTELVNYPRFGTPFTAGEYIFFTKNDGLQNQPVYWYQQGAAGEPKVFIDPNSLSTDGTVAISLGGFNKSKTLVSVITNKAGSDWQDITIYDIATAKPLPDKIDWVKFSGTAWKGNGFYYSAYPKPEKGTELSGQNKLHRIYYHKLGDKQENDLLVYEDKAHPLRFHTTSLTEDERFLILYISEGTDGTEVMYQDLEKGDKKFKPLFKGFKYNYSVLDNLGDKLLVMHNNEASNYKVSLVDPQNPDIKNWKDVLPEKPELLESAALGGGKLFAKYLKDVTNRLYRYNLDGSGETEIKLPALGTATNPGGWKTDTELYFTFTSFTYPPEIYKYEIATGKTEIFRKSQIKFDPSLYETKQVFYPSKDGTKIPMFLVHKKGLVLDGNNPTYLYGYGGFNVSLSPSFSALNLILFENGGILALPNIRGGGEYGEKWHKAGMLLNKQNVFNDFIGAAEYLIKEKYTSASRLAISGGSNGGLLVGACMTQRPDLFKVAFPAVGVLDMLRFHKFTIGWGWVVEYGSSDSANHFSNLYKYSPLHNLKPNTEYPATLVTTADHDDRVVPAHSFKFIATLQEVQKGTNPVLIRIETKAGHGAGKSITKAIEETADKWAFMFHNMGVEVINQ